MSLRAIRPGVICPEKLKKSWFGVFHSGGEVLFWKLPTGRVKELDRRCRLWREASASAVADIDGRQAGRSRDRKADRNPSRRFFRARRFFPCLVPRQATFARQGAASGACSRRAGRKPSYWTYLGFRPVRRECVPGVATGRTLPVAALGGVSKVLCGARGVRCVLSARRTKALVLDVLGVSAGAARVRAGRRGCCAGLSKHPLGHRWCPRHSLRCRGR